MEFALLFPWRAGTLNNDVCEEGNRGISGLFVWGPGALDSAQLNQLLLMGPSAPDDLDTLLLLVKE